MIYLIHATVTLGAEYYRSADSVVAVGVGADERRKAELATTPIDGVTGRVCAYKLEARFIPVTTKRCNKKGIKNPFCEGLLIKQAG